MNRRGVILEIFFGFVLFACLSYATLPTITQANDRQKELNFEDELIEGVNKRPLDSLNTLGETDREKRRQRLYQKKPDFQSETQHTLRDLRYQ